MDREQFSESRSDKDIYNQKGYAMEEKKTHSKRSRDRKNYSGHVGVLTLG